MNAILSLQLFSVDAPLDSSCSNSGVSCNSDASCKSTISTVSSS